MPLIARTRFTAHINGRDISLDAGATFQGTQREADRFIALGLLEKPERPKTKRKEDTNER